MLYNLNVNEVPYYLHYNKVTSGYRKGGTYIECFKSMFTIFHNETVNAFTSLFNSFISTYGLIYGYYNNFDIIPLLIWFFGITLNSLMSFGFHTFSPISKKTFNILRNLDVNSIYFSSICQCICFSILFLPFHLFCINLLYLLILICFSIYKFIKLDPEKHVNVNEQTFIISLYLLSLSFSLIYHNLYIYSSYQTYIYLYYIIGSLTITGILYSLRVPEVFFKEGTFNKIGHSHNIMHIGISLFFYYQFMFLKEYYLYKY